MTDRGNKMIKLKRLEYRNVTEKVELTLDNDALLKLSDYIKQEYVPVNSADEIPTLTDDIITAIWNGETFDGNCNVRYRSDTWDSKGMSLSDVVMDEIDNIFADSDVEYTIIDSECEDCTPIVISERD
jgi:hypothetical protein